MKTLEFSLFPVHAPHGILVSINDGGNDNSCSAFHLRIIVEGNVAERNVKYYDEGWNDLVDADVGISPVRFGKWNTLRIEASIVAGGTSQAAVFVNGTFIGTAGLWHHGATVCGGKPASAMDRVRFLSGSTADFGDEYYVDDVRFRP